MFFPSLQNGKRSEEKNKELLRSNCQVKYEHDQDFGVLALFYTKGKENVVYEIKMLTVYYCDATVTKSKDLIPNAANPSF